MSTAIIDLDDTQGLLIQPRTHGFARYLFLRVDTAAVGRAWLNVLAPVIPPDAGDSFFALSDWAICKVRAEWTGGRFSVVEQVTVPGVRPPLHTHEFEEIHYIVEGEYDYWQGDNPPKRATAGAVVWTPRGVVHTYENVGATNGRLVAVFMPGGFERFFEEFGMPSSATSTPPPSLGVADIARLARIVEEKYWTKVVEPIRGR